MKRVERKKSSFRWLKITLLLVGAITLGVGIYSFTVYTNAKNTVNDKMHEPVQSIDTTKTKQKIKATEPLNILLLGIDAESGEKGRSDALILLTLEPKSDRMQLVSIPRDTRTTIVGKQIEDKINHSYAFGGTDMTIATVENFLDIDIDYYVRMNMAGLKELVSELGTITVNNEIEWRDNNYTFTKGPIVMDADQTMAFVRMRKQDPAGDFGRTKRQRQVIQGIINEGASIGSVTKIDRMINIFGTNMATNMDFDDMKKIFGGYKDTRKNVTEYMIEGTGKNIDGIYYMIVSEEEVQKVHGMIKEMEM
ncbi:LCP family glycopolymer transferase [Virgibacillus sp. W0430]|uniref:LCP family glycopolymer transferase n=1 Tax=Virgibacillus sp. W0430 TaxID=3391580 RepID=UPI003F46F6F5